ncbi:MAG: tRNA 4-thiouridine(8) synthase ThiI [bacterium (Candidatus Ratteibacteria) CG_4_10_14_3_um_filter_41_18]|uniref:tRNA 4-thiouridine(8) synthase ThiI n=4 Tax=Candidatus Ratteibacteria TaxID=2979319 RepID=A0A2M7E766_9BACT|nr:MAG: hypothetical protein AUJ76_04590 [Candidatus Omnitrophica bacterium CG1_02_41_171]PIV63564.1 MAG: tRNA 4-thiouridine(8) synthase ThiI [bacterium (Candidatus Ratteibacteria) CG01_land_8_20_14_3_00_40_19]PIW33088.1 MAG: tRNA 4-thiouridine(8) synthase ThiI [bacterium (Candidatus Ratteibacteria) CG15_BIG_FIL_POST_REV_8_21_14_020_41_12]PIW74357.1 MAG: tRNA 4-thiouridine(8) synthase ThiI [bacterium (Candidatus Ratteibacteria) CG_4_8_14_3_um_filter_41_36]PIX77172.1 MAG: tRNA 4-thiouridine(8) s
MKAVALLSGGLDSVLALELVLSQKIEVKGVNFVTPFLQKNQEFVLRQAEELGIALVTIKLGEDYLELVRNPKHHYGRYLNPCIDCRILMFGKAKDLFEEEKSFLVTGEVLGQRPSSQYKSAFLEIEKEAGLFGRVLRPLSAKLLPLTIPEKEGLVNREELLAIEGRSRKQQLKLAKEFGITNYLSPAGGCLLTEKEFSVRLGDLFVHKKKIKISEMELLKLGRHFRLSPEIKLIVGRNEKENKSLASLAGEESFFLEAEGVPGPLALLEKGDKKFVSLAAGIVAAHSDARDFSSVPVNYWNSLEKSSIVVKPLKDIEKLRVLRIGSRL